MVCTNNNDEDDDKKAKNEVSSKRSAEYLVAKREESYKRDTLEWNVKLKKKIVYARDEQHFKEIFFYNFKKKFENCKKKGC